MTSNSDLKQVEEAASAYVAKELSDALSAFWKDGNVEKALKRYDNIRDEGIRMVAHDPELQNEIECRRLERRIDTAFYSKDSQLICDVLQDVGRSGRFSSERLHYFLGVIGGYIRDLGKAMT